MEGQSIHKLAEVPTLAAERRDRELAAKVDLHERLDRELRDTHDQHAQLESDRDACQHAYAIAIHAIEVRVEALSRALTVYHEDDPDEAGPPLAGFARQLRERPDAGDAL